MPPRPDNRNCMRASMASARIFWALADAGCPRPDVLFPAGTEDMGDVEMYWPGVHHLCCCYLEDGDLVVWIEIRRRNEDGHWQSTIITPDRSDDEKTSAAIDALKAVLV